MALEEFINTEVGQILKLRNTDYEGTAFENISVWLFTG